MLIATLHFVYEYLIKKHDKREFLESLDERKEVIISSVESLRIENKYSDRAATVAHIINNNSLEKEVDVVMANLGDIFSEDASRYRLSETLKRIVADVIRDEMIEFNKYLARVNEGSFTVREELALQATKHCMQNAEREVFAISFPDVELLNTKEGSDYLAANYRAINSNPEQLRIKRFVIIRDNSEDDVDYRVFSSDRVSFIQLLLEQISHGIEVHLLHVKELRLKSIVFKAPDRRPNTIPDISVYDGEIVSEWIVRDSDSVDETIIAYAGVYRDDAMKLRRLLTSSDFHRVRTAEEISQRLDEIAKSNNIKVSQPANTDIEPNYEVLIYWSREDKEFQAEVPELPGCVADGITRAEALQNAEVVIAKWIETARSLGREIPEPKGKLVYA